MVLASASLATAAQEQATLPKPGMALVAADQLQDGNFARTVVLIIQRGYAGTVGIVLNRPTASRVVDALPDLPQGLRTGEHYLYRGGPLSPDGISILLGGQRAPPGTRRVSIDLAVIASPAGLSALAAQPGPWPTIRYFAGYAGWGPGQLEAELARGDWHLARIDAEHALARDVSTMWHDLIVDFRGRWALR